MIRKICTIIFLLSFSFSSFAEDNSVIIGKVERIISGDIVTVLTENGRMFVRLAGIDSPDLKQPYGKESQTALEHLIGDKIVILRLVGLDPCGRSIAMMWIKDDEGIDVSSRMITSGDAWVYRSYAKSKYLLELEQHAREEKVGIWSLKPDEQIPPWEWRKRARFKGINPSDACPVQPQHYDQSNYEYELHPAEFS